MPGLDEIEALTGAYGEAVAAKDPARLAALYADEVRVFDTWGRRPFDGLAAWRVNLDEWLMSLGEHERVQASFREIQTSHRGKMGCLHALVIYAALNPAGEVLRSMQNRLTWVVAKTAKGWVIVHEHTSVRIGPDLKGVLQPD